MHQIKTIRINMCCMVFTTSNTGMLTSGHTYVSLTGWRTHVRRLHGAALARGTVPRTPHALRGEPERSIIIEMGNLNIKKQTRNVLTCFAPSTFEFYTPKAVPYHEPTAM